MTAFLIAMTIVEVLLVLGVLVAYLVAIARSLRRTARTLGRVSFGVRAIEQQCASIGPGVTTVNGQLAGVADALDRLAGLAAPARRRAGRSG